MSAITQAPLPDAHALLQTLALVFSAAAVTSVVFHRLRQPVVFGYLLAGMIVGPHIPVPLVADQATIRMLSELGVILLMFSLGLEFRLQRVVRMAGTSGLAALAETSVMFGLGFGASRVLGLNTMECVFAGAMVAISSTTIIAKALEEHLIRGRVREVVFGILIVEDLIAILLLTLLTALAAGGTVSASSLAMTSFRLATFLAGLIGVGLLIVPRTMRAVLARNQSEMTLVASVGICFAAALVALAFGYSVALGAFIAGSLVAESGGSSVIEPLVQPVRDLFVALFFVAVGMLIDPMALATHWPTVLALVLVVLIGKAIAVTIGAFLVGNDLRASVETGMSLAQIGEFSFIIAAIGTATGAIRPFLYPVIVAVSALTTLTTPWLIRSASAAASYIDRKLPKPIQTFSALYGSWIDRMRAAHTVPGGQLRIRRLVRLIALDVALLAFVIIGTASERERMTVIMRTWGGFSDRIAYVLVLGVSITLAIPLVVGLVRVTWRLAVVLAVRALPAPESGVDFAQAPRTAFVTALHVALLLAIGAPLFVLAQIVLPGISTAVLILGAVIIVAIAFRRSIRELHGHVRAGAEIIVAALARHTTLSDEEFARTMEQVGTALPGLGAPTPLVLPESSPAIGRTLAELNLRGLTGATVLCISRHGASEAEQLIPTGKERLRVGDVLALAGRHDAVANARELLAPSA